MWRAEDANINDQRSAATFLDLCLQKGEFRPFCIQRTNDSYGPAHDGIPASSDALRWVDQFGRRLATIRPLTRDNLEAPAEPLPGQSGCKRRAVPSSVCPC